MDIIHLLPDSVANQIAAGEVIQRPSSCLKELVENSLDAGATNIQVIVRDAGRTLLQVIDNGSGMSETDARMAFERHATSKIRQASDLFSLHTMGFRGEALASIAAVAQLEVLTRREEDEVGTLLEIAGSEVINEQPMPASVGTSIKVKNLFYNVPARRRFLKTNSTELRNIINDFYRIILVYPNVQFLLVSDDEVLLDMPIASLKQRIEGVFGKQQRHKFAEQLIEIHADTPMVNIFGYIGKPESAQKQSQQYFFVNGRYMKHPYFHKAVMTAYSGMLPADVAPTYFIYFDIQPDAIDVNIHPTKTEIKFADEQSVWQILLAALRESLGRFNITPSIDFDREGDISIPIANTAKQIIQPVKSVDQSYNPFVAQQRKSYVPSGWEQLYAVDRQRKTDFPVFEDFMQDSNISALSPIGDPYQMRAEYVIQPVTEGLLIISQNLAHTVIMYNQFLHRFSDSRATTQQVLFAEILDLSADDRELLLSMHKDLCSVGFEISQVAPNSFSVDGVPAELGTQSAVATLLDIINIVKQTGQTTVEVWRQKIALILAKETAIKTGKELSVKEMKDMVDKLFSMPDYARTPEGKRVMILIENDEISKRFNI